MHGWGAVVVVVAGIVVVVVVVVLVVDSVVLVVVDAVVVLLDSVVVDSVVVVVDAVVVVVDVVAVVVVVGFSQLVPDDPGWQTQRYPLVSVARQMPPLRHGFGLHGRGRVVLVVVVPGLHTAEPGGADVPGGQAVQEVAAPSEKVSSGQEGHSGDPGNGAEVPAGQALHEIAPLPSE